MNLYGIRDLRYNFYLFKYLEALIIEQLENYKNKLTDKYGQRVDIWVNTPCHEFWYLLHFEPTGKYYPKCNDVSKVLVKNKYLANYEKTEKYYKKKDNDIYLKLKKSQSAAMVNAKILGNFDFKNPQSAKAEIYNIFCFLEIFQCVDKG